MPLVPGFTHVPANKLDKLEAALTDNTAAVIMEVVQGEGGVPMGRGFCAVVRSISPRKAIPRPLVEILWPVLQHWPQLTLLLKKNYLSARRPRGTILECSSPN